MRNAIRISFVVAALVSTLSLVAQPVGKPAGGGNSIEWQLTKGGHVSIEVRVIAPDGQEYVSTHKGGGNPAFKLSQLGSDLQDGQYNYELRVTPAIPAGVAKQLADARKANDDVAARKILKAAGLSPVTQSGSFTVINGWIVDPNAIEADTNDAVSGSGRFTASNDALRPRTPTTDDQVIPDDLIVQGSICAGFDCVNNESFGFDTIRMKENNTRIKFEDTSSSAGFSTNDWQLTANDSASGGASKFSIEDITGAKVPFTVTGGASTNSIFVDSTGRVGFRTGTPVLDLHVSTSNTPALRLEQTNAGGFTAQTWDIGANEANFFVRDVTGGSKLSLRIRPGAPTSSLDIAASGNVGIGTASPEQKLHVFSATNADALVGLGPDPDGSTGTDSAFNFGYAGSSFGIASGFINVRPSSNATAPNPSLRLMTANVVRVLIDNEGFLGLGDTASGGLNPTSPIQYTNGAVTARLTTAGVWQDNSSRVAKENIESLDAETAFQALAELQPVTYNYKVLPDDPKVGFIAEDVPAIVAAPERDGLSALDIVAVLTKVVQEQDKTIQELKTRLDGLEKNNQQH
jgi:hypothetical protein